jgi:hypothetical protein
MAHFAAALKATLEALWSSNTWANERFPSNIQPISAAFSVPDIGMFCFTLSHGQDFVLRAGVALRFFALRAVTGKRHVEAVIPCRFEPCE